MVITTGSNPKAIQPAGRKRKATKSMKPRKPKGSKPETTLEKLIKGKSNPVKI